MRVRTCAQHGRTAGPARLSAWRAAQGGAGEGGSAGCTHHVEALDALARPLWRHVERIGRGGVGSRRLPDHVRPPAAVQGLRPEAQPTHLAMSRRSGRGRCRLQARTAQAGEKAGRRPMGTHAQRRRLTRLAARNSFFKLMWLGRPGPSQQGGRDVLASRCRNRKTLPSLRRRTARDRWRTHSSTKCE